MIRYFDTSFLVPLLISEPNTHQVEEFFASLYEDETLLFSRWGQLEPVWLPACSEWAK